MVAELTATKELVDIADKLGVLDTIKNKLLGSPAAARSQLAAVLTEISKIYSAIDGEMSDYLAIVFTGDAKDDEASRKLLLALEGGRSRPRIAEARGHCKKILHIYTEYLCPWFEDVLSKQEQERVRLLFVHLSDTDGMMMNALDSITDWLTAQAMSTLTLAKSVGIEAANREVDEARLVLLKPRRTISECLYRMRLAEGDLISSAGSARSASKSWFKGMFGS